MLDDALEESFNDLLEDDAATDGGSVVFSADDFAPQTGSLAPPQEKPPPLPSVPPPPVPSFASDFLDVSLV